MKYVSNVLFWISNGLLVPVIVGLLYFFVNSILLLGIFFSQYLTHSKQTNPCYINKTADINLAAKRIAWGKLLNSGQTCIAPDYVLVDEEVEPQFIDALSKEFKKNTGAMGKPEGLMKVINEEAFDRIVSYTEETGSVIGGRYNRDERSRSEERV